MYKLVFILTVIVAVVSYEISCNDPNAAPPPAGCAVNCNRYCSNFLNNENTRCPRVQCPPNQCGCKSGYYFDKNCGKCVPPEQCTSPQPE